jgi:arsenate reductase
MENKTYNILFLCTGNSARSILAEALATTMSNGRLIGYSAGSHPQGTVNPYAIDFIREIGYPVEKLRSKSWDEYATNAAPPMDFIITVCDNAAGEICPIWPGKPTTAHWGFPDPASVTGDDAQKRKAFADVALGLKHRLDLLLSLPIDSLDKLSIQTEIRKIGLAN